MALRPRLAAADAFVLIVPECNRSVPGPLKTLIDSFRSEWEAKPVGFVGYGLSLTGGVRAVEHLRQVSAEFHAVGMKDVVLFPRVLEHYDAQGRFPAEPEAPRPRPSSCSTNCSGGRWPCATPSPYARTASETPAWCAVPASRPWWAR